MLSVMELSDKTLQDPSNVLDDEISFKSEDKTLQGPSKVLDDEISFESDDNMTIQNSQDNLAATIDKSEEDPSNVKLSDIAYTNNDIVKILNCLSLE